MKVRMSVGMEIALIKGVLEKIRDSSDLRFTIAKNKPENSKTIIDLGYTDELIKEVICNLDPCDCMSSFGEDRGGYAGYVFEFGKIINSREIYIKFRVVFDKKFCGLSCISFHYAKYKIKYKFK